MNTSEKQTSARERQAGILMNHIVSAGFKYSKQTNPSWDTVDFLLLIACPVRNQNVSQTLVVEQAP